MEMDLVISVRRDAMFPIIDLSGEVDAYTSARFREAMVDLIENGAASLKKPSRLGKRKTLRSHSGKIGHASPQLNQVSPSKSCCHCRGWHGFSPLFNAESSLVVRVVSDALLLIFQPQTVNRIIK